MQIDREAACRLLQTQDNILILAHQKPDGDTLGSSFALYEALTALGKKAKVLCGDEIPQKYGYLYAHIAFPKFEPQFVVAVDVADLKLLGKLESEYGTKVDLCIDHHPSNREYAKQLLLDPESPATALIIYDVIKGLRVPFTKRIANAVFTGLSTDTGCFRYANVTARTHRVAADMIEAGAEHGMINRLMFETKSQQRLAIENLTMSTLEYFLQGRLAVAYTTLEMMQHTGAADDDLEGISSILRSIEGVEVAVSIKERAPGVYRASLRCYEPFNVSKICQQLGGGGHAMAAGCTVEGSIEQAKQKIVTEIEKQFRALGEL